MQIKRIGPGRYRMTLPVLSEERLSPEGLESRRFWYPEDHEPGGLVERMYRMLPVVASQAELAALRCFDARSFAVLAAIIHALIDRLGSISVDELLANVGVGGELSLGPYTTAEIEALESLGGWQPYLAVALIFTLAHDAIACRIIERLKPLIHEGSFAAK